MCFFLLLSRSFFLVCVTERLFVSLFVHHKRIAKLSRVCTRQRFRRFVFMIAECFCWADESFKCDQWTHRNGNAHNNINVDKEKENEGEMRSRHSERKSIDSVFPQEKFQWLFSIVIVVVSVLHRFDRSAHWKQVILDQQTQQHSTEHTIFVVVSLSRSAINSVQQCWCRHKINTAKWFALESDHDRSTVAEKITFLLNICKQQTCKQRYQRFLTTITRQKIPRKKKYSTKMLESNST